MNFQSTVEACCANVCLRCVQDDGNEKPLLVKMINLVSESQKPALPQSALRSEFTGSRVHLYFMSLITLEPVEYD